MLLMQYKLQQVVTLPYSRRNEENAKIKKFQ